MRLKSKVLIIAGSDSSGGAGIQADIKTVTSLGSYAMTAITAVTAQNTTGVKSIIPIHPKEISNQIEYSAKDIRPQAIKIGMLHSKQVILAVNKSLNKIKIKKIILDPVMVAKGGARLLFEDAVVALSEYLLPRATLLTPNIPEAEALTGIKASDEAALYQIGETLLEKGAQAVLLKGGHLIGSTIVDRLFTSSGVEIFKNPRIDTRHTHGTGCTLASAIAAGISDGLTISDAVNKAEIYLHKAIEGAPGFGSGYGPIDHTHTVRK